ncbi:MAG: phosphoglycerate kinase [Patescibacteria group bacterium]
MRQYQFVDIPKNLRGKTALVRVDFNEPLKGGRIKDSFRIKHTVPTIKLLRARGARIVLLAHIEDEKKHQLSFKPLTREIGQMLGAPVTFDASYDAEKIRMLAEKNIVLLENIRFHKGEEKNDPQFARLLASFGDLYINEGFSVSHRDHASIVGVPTYLASYAGPLFRREVEKLSHVLNPSKPFLVIVGGAKFDTKFALLKKFVPRADAVFVGGVLANTFLAAHDLEVGKSLYEKKALRDIQKHFLLSKKIILPFDVRLGDKGRVESAFEIGKNDCIYDIGPQTIAVLGDIVRTAKTILWNGPLGYLEGGHDQGTRDLLRLLARAKGKVIIGGGDTLEVLDQMRIGKSFFHVSTGGGAMLDFLADGTLPGIDALRKSKARVG